MLGSFGTCDIKVDQQAPVLLCLVVYAKAINQSLGTVRYDSKVSSEIVHVQYTCVTANLLDSDYVLCVYVHVHTLSHMYTCTF